MIHATRRLHELIVGRITFPLTNSLCNRRRILSTYRRQLAAEKMPPERLKALQLEKLRQLLFFADRWSPFYRERFARVGLAPEDLRSLSDLAAIPPLTREDLVEHLPDLIDRRRKVEFQQAVETDRRGQPIPFSRFRRHRLIRNSTSGSTGTPVVTFEDGSLSAVSWASELRVKHWFEVAPGAREARLKGWAQDLPAGPHARMRRALWNQLALPGFGLIEEDHRENLRRMARFQPQVLWSCTITMVRLAEFLQEHGRRPPFRPKLVVTWAEPLPAHEKALLEETFRCPVTNIYGGREVGHLGATCAEGELHSNQESFFLETTRPYSGDCPGELMVTPLFETPLPLIRYQIGDLAELDPHPCACGRNLERICRLSGRSVERFTTSDGRRTIAGSMWPDLFAADPCCGGVRRFQTVYRADGGLCFRIVRRENYSSQTEEFVRDYLHKHVQADLQVDFEFPDEIAVDPSGKFPLLIDERSPA